MARKIINKNSPGTSTTFAADDWDYVNKYLTGIDQSAIDTVEIKTNTGFWDNRLRVWNPAKTKSYRIRGLAIVNDYDLTLPLLSSNDEIMGLLTTQTPQNKIINVANNTLRAATNAIGDLLVSNGTKYDRLAMGSTGGYVLAVKSDLSGLEWVAAPGGAGGGGTITTGSNVGTAGVGVFKQVSGTSLQFKKLNAASGGLVNIIDDTANSEVDLKIAGGGDGQYLKTVGTTPTWSTLSTAYGRIMPDGSNYSGKRYGVFLGGANDGDGVLGGLTMISNWTSTTSAAGMTTDFYTDAIDDSWAGWQSPFRIARRSFNPHFKTKFLVSPSTEKTWTGFLGVEGYPGGGVAGANPLANRYGVMAGYDVGDANWLLRWNDASASPQTYNTGTPKDTVSHIVEFFMDETTDAVKIIWDGTQLVNSTTQVPASHIDHICCSTCESDGGQVVTLKTEWGQITYDTIFT